MKHSFKPFTNWLSLHDGSRKPRINFQDMYKLFPNFEFVGTSEFGSYKNYGQAYECKVYDMTVRDIEGDEIFMTYREYMDANENLAYAS